MIKQTSYTSKGFFSYSVSSALSSAGLTSARYPLISAKKNLSVPKNKIEAHRQLQKMISHLDQQIYAQHPRA